MLIKNKISKNVALIGIVGILKTPSNTKKNLFKNKIPPKKKYVLTNPTKNILSDFLLYFDTNLVSFKSELLIFTIIHALSKLSIAPKMFGHFFSIA